MKLIIDIDENLYKEVQNEVKGKVYVSGLWKSIANGIPVLTDGDLNSLNEYQGEWAKGFHEGFNAGNMLAEAFSEDTPYKDAYNKTLEEMKKECRSMTKPMEYLYYGECLGTFEQTFNKHLREAGNETDN